jgi:hypothetical protein
MYNEKSVLMQIDEQICTACLGNENDYILIKGFLPLGHDVSSQVGMGVEEAKVHCDSLPVCQFVRHSLSI